MMDELSSEEPGPKDTSPLIDLAGFSLDDVARMDDSALAHSLNRILGDTANPDEVILASFSASV
jgi:FXSXX-COOH protein